MKQPPQEPASRFLDQTGKLQDIGELDLPSGEPEALSRLLPLFVDLKLVDQPKTHAVQMAQTACDRAEAVPLLELDEQAAAPTLPTAVLTPGGDRQPPLPPPPPPPGQRQLRQQTAPKLLERASADSTDAFEQLQGLLVGSELSHLRELTAALEQKLGRLEHQIYEPAALMSLLQPWMAELLMRKIAASKEEVVQAIAPIIDQAIQSRGKQDKVSMSTAIAPLIATAIAQQTHHSPEELALAIAPTISRAIKEQIRLEQDAMVDALYPIIGSTIVKYMAEAIQSINQQIEKTLSPEGIQRKIRAKLQGVSEAELILKQAIPFTVQAIFLIHKASGLLIAERQPVGHQSLESELLAGMLTAIRSFANDCMAQAGTTSELDQIDYGGAKIILEVAGYCYLAVVVQGEPPRSFMSRLRQTLSVLVKQYGNQLETFEGDPETIPVAVPASLEALRDHFADDRPTQTAKPPFMLLGALGLLALVGVSWGVVQYQQSIVRQAEAKTALVLAATPALAVYRLDVKAQHGTLTLTGRLPNPALRWQAEQVARRAAPDWAFDNQIVAVEVPPDPTLAAAEVKRVTTLLNRTDGTNMTTRYADGRVLVEGNRSRTIAASTITQAFSQIPGVRSVTNTVAVAPLQIPLRVYFNPASATLQPVDKSDKIKPVIAFLQQYPNQKLHLIGHGDQWSGADEKPTLALKRALAVRDALVSQGIDASRLQVLGAAELAPDQKTPLAWQRRYVAFEPIAASTP
jgi:outer membrane protein OmpA-like peptidoglycan-associated protein